MKTKQVLRNVTGGGVKSLSNQQYKMLKQVQHDIKCSFSVLTNKINKSLAFTLAEVLITLGIIGVVAALTIPSLIANVNSARYKAQYKKTLSTLNQAVKMNQAQYGFDFGNVTSIGSINDVPQENTTVFAIFNGNLNGQINLNIASSVYKTMWRGRNDYWSEIKLADGSTFLFMNDNYVSSSTLPCTVPEGTPALEASVVGTSSGPTLSTTTHGCIGMIDVNGDALPNKEVSCIDSNSDNPFTCVINNNTIGDMFPVLYHDGVVEPGSIAAKAVLQDKK